MKLFRLKFTSKILVLLLALVISLLFTTSFVNAEDNTTGEVVTETESESGGLLSESVEVYITVSDITDYTNPMNVLVPRRKLTVTEFDMTPYGATLEDINTINGVTYMHAIVQLHLDLYGEEIGEKLLLSDDGVTRYFMGRQTANVMYKNGNDIFELPQNVPIEDGDEIQVCLYNSSYSQGIATFSDATYSGYAGKAVDISLFEHFDSPRNRQAMSGAEIVNQNGLYYTDSDGNIITTSADGSFDITFDKVATVGEYILADTFAPPATISVVIMGDIIVINFAIFSIMIFALFHIGTICENISRIIARSPINEIKSLMFCESALLFSPCKIPHKTAIITIDVKDGKDCLTPLKNIEPK